MIVLACPGQGSQTPGFLSPWLEDSANRELINEFSQAVGLDLEAHGTVSNAEVIKDTAIAQPLIVAAGLVTLQSLLASTDAVPAGIVGHSVGEITAATGAGVLSVTEAARFVGARATAMAEAAAVVETGMAAVLGGDEAVVLERLAELGLSPANYNGGGQIVVAGPVDALEALRAEPAAGTRVIPLKVAGAFHTSYMASAQAKLGEVATSLEPKDPSITLWTNNDGSVIDSGAKFVELLVTQVASPVRWDKNMAALAEAGVTGVIELAPAGALVGLAKRGLKGVPTVAVKTPDDLPAAVELLAQG